MSAASAAKSGGGREWKAASVGANRVIGPGWGEATSWLGFAFQKWIVGPCSSILKSMWSEADLGEEVDQPGGLDEGDEDAEVGVEHL